VRSFLQAYATSPEMRWLTSLMAAALLEAEPVGPPRE